MKPGEKAGVVLKLIMEELVPDKRGNDFSLEVIDILSIALREIISASFCREHQPSIINKIMDQLTIDLDL